MHENSARINPIPSLFHLQSIVSNTTRREGRLIRTGITAILSTLCIAGTRDLA